MIRATGGVSFVDGFSPRKELIGVVAYLKELNDQDAEFSRFYTILNGNWMHREIHQEIRSVVYTKQGPAWWLLGKRGDVIQVTGSGVTSETIVDAGTGPDRFGYLNRIVEVGGTLFACGYRRQVYRRDSKGWVHIDQGILAPKSEVAIGFFGMAGSAPDDLYAVGRKGEIYHYDGTRWTRSDSPTSVDLEAVFCVSKDDALVCGKEGVILRGNRDAWQVIDVGEFRETLWAVQVYREIPYFAAGKGLYRLTRDGLVPVDTGLPTPIDGYRLHASDGLLWSIGTNGITSFDGTSWRAYPCPDNP